MLDDLDIKVLNILQESGRTKRSELAEMVGDNFHLHVIKGGEHSYGEPNRGLEQRQKILRALLN